MKFFGFFLENIWGKWPEPKFLTSWSRSRIKMDRLRNTGIELSYLYNTGTYF
jgi:hypothetical protein